MAGVPFIVWRDEYSVGHPELDAHHHRICTILNDLYESTRTNAASEEVGKLVREVIDYGRIHFRAEERALRDTRYPKLLEQERSHHAYNRKLEDLLQQYHSGSQPLSHDIFLFLKDWWLNHIMGMDKEYGPHLRSQKSENGRL